MRYLKDIPHPQLKIGLYAWNNKYIVKIEADRFEQTYKISELDVVAADDVVALLDEPFLARVQARFGAMATDWHETAGRHELG